MSKHDPKRPARRLARAPKPDEAQRTQKMRAQLEAAKAELARQNEEIAELAALTDEDADVDPVAMAAAEAAFEKVLAETAPPPPRLSADPGIPAFALRA